ncbi:hypothetical protein DPEC_G00263320 [Dallia pectoralis]|uniref:Uncharacterized protein n=1 Tax=Dallia pectoralis TaxID=75939 RepID=A0ACC2FS83_DALPE|nr:hypothetical protein DPEC_G00263320 [Dallia pectoralis]
MAEDGELNQMGSPIRSGQCVRQTYRSRAHSCSLLGGLLGLRQGGILFDVVLLVEDRPIKAHRILLAASCEYFRLMFAGGLRETHLTEIPVYGVTYTAMSKLLDFIYTSELELDLDTVQEVLVAATLTQIEDVIGFCSDFLFSWLDDSNVLEVDKLADMFGLLQLGNKVHSYILRNIQTLSRTDVYRQLPSERVFGVLNSDKLEVSSENEVYEAALHYHYKPEQVETDQVSLQDNLKMLEAVRFCLMDKQVLQRLFGRLKQCPLKDLVSSALRYHEQELWQPVLQCPLTQPRSSHNCILCFGGMSSSGSQTETEDLFQVYQPGWGDWRTLMAAQTHRMSNQGIAVINNFVYLIGGDKNVSGFHAETQCWRYDPRHNRWCSVKPLQQQRADLCVCVLDGHIYAIAGRDYSNELQCVERYDPHTNAWEYVAALSKPVYAHAGVVSEGKMYITCGRRGIAYLRETTCYDPQRNQWVDCTQSPVERAWHGMAAVNGRVYVIGGSNVVQGYRRDVLKVACYSSAANSWSVMSPLPAGHGEPGVAVLDNRIYIMGGRSHDKGNLMKYVHVYDTEGDYWEIGTAFKDRTSGLAACVALVSRSVIGQAKTWEQRTKSSWEEAGLDNSEESSDD